jgi:anamorsin
MALVVTDEVALPVRAVGDLAAAADVPREEVAVITQCEALGESASSLALHLSWMR